MISAVVLRNWKSHMESELRFSKGVNAIIGIMGSGKTSILQAISFGLYGTFPALQGKRMVLDDVIMKKPQKMDTAEVRVDFSAAGKQYSVTREIRRGRGTVRAELRESGKLVEATPHGVTEHVSSVLEMDYELFSRAVYSEQNSIDYFLKIPKGRRMEHIDGMLRLDEFEAVREKSVSLSNRIRHEREGRLRIISELRKEGLPERISALREELEALKEGAEKAETEAAEASQAVLSLEERVAGLESDDARLAEARRLTEGLKSGISQIDESLLERSPLVDGLDVGTLRERSVSIENEIQGLDKAIEESRAAIDEGRMRIASLNTEIRIAEEGIRDIKRLGDRCPVCESEISEEKRSGLIEARRAASSARRDEASRLAGEVKDRMESLGAAESLRSGRMREREKLESQIREMGFIEGLEARRREAVARLEKIAAKEAELEEKLSGIDMKQLRNELKSAVGRHRELMAGLTGTRQRIRDREAVLKDLRRREDLLITYRQEASSDQDAMERLALFTKALSATQDQLRAEFLKNVNAAMNRVWREIYPYGDFTAIRLEIDKDYVLQLKEEGGWINVEGIASGGERSVAALALRVAFSLAFIPNLRWLILDEPTHNLDSNAIQSLTDALSEKISGFAEQVFLITHDERVSEGVGGSLYRLERNKDRNEPTRVAGSEPG